MVTKVIFDMGDPGSIPGRHMFFPIFGYLLLISLFLYTQHDDFVRDDFTEMSQCFGPDYDEIDKPSQYPGLHTHTCESMTKNR